MFKATLEYMETYIFCYTMTLLGSSHTWTPCKLLTHVNKEDVKYPCNLKVNLEDIEGDMPHRFLPIKEMIALVHTYIDKDFTSWFTCIIHFIHTLPCREPSYHEVVYNWRACWFNKKLLLKPLDIDMDTMLVLVLHEAIEFGPTSKSLKKPL